MQLKLLINGKVSLIQAYDQQAKIINCKFKLKKIINDGQTVWKN